ALHPDEHSRHRHHCCVQPLAREAIGMSRRKPSEFPFALLLLPVAAVIVGPFLWLIVSSLKTAGEIGRGESFSFPANLMWQTYVDAWTAGGFGSLIGDSLINAALVVILTLLICVLAGYALA